MDELLVGTELLGLEAFGDGAGEIAFAVPGHADRQLRVEVRVILGEDCLEFRDGAVVLLHREVEHRVVVAFLVLSRVGFHRHAYGTRSGRAQASR